MDREQVLHRVNAVFRDIFDDDTLAITEENSAADIPDWDSLTHIALLAEIEECFGIRFSMKDVLGMQKVGNLLDIIVHHT
ncbi:MAG: acyl carrier protein [Clostridiales bacterium]|nr:acyl carrier protein [Clostridiales bacterium]